MSRPTLEVADIVRAAGNSFWEKHKSHFAWVQQLLDVVLCGRDLAPGLKDQLNGFGIAGHFLLVPRCERFDIEIGKQSLNFTVGESAAFNASR